MFYMAVPETGVMLCVLAVSMVIHCCDVPERPTEKAVDVRREKSDSDHSDASGVLVASVDDDEVPRSDSPPSYSECVRA